MRKYAIILTLTMSALLAACGNDKEQTTTTNNADLVTEGEKIAKSSCIGCHAADLTGDMGPNLHNLSLSKEEIISVLEKGRGSMPPATAKGHEEAVAEYLLTLK